jgi:protein SCO1/2
MQITVVFAPEARQMRQWLIDMPPGSTLAQALVQSGAMAELAEVKRSLGADGARLQGLFITLDPERDTPEVLKAYMANFDPSFLALRPTLEQLPQVAKDFKIFYRKVEGQTPTSYTLEHGSGRYVYDPQGRVRLFARHELGAAALAGDLKILLAGK